MIALAVVLRAAAAWAMGDAMRPVKRAMLAIFVAAMLLAFPVRMEAAAVSSLPSSMQDTEPKPPPASAELKPPAASATGTNATGTGATGKRPTTASKNTAPQNDLAKSIADQMKGSQSTPWAIVFGLTLLTLLPALLLSMTPMIRLLVVFHFLRQALGTQTAPSNQVLMGLALMMTWFLMQPVLLQVEQRQ